MGRGVIKTAFDLLEHVRLMEPARLTHLASASGIPKATVYRMLGQLADVGAVRRDGERYRLGAALLELGEHVTPERQLRALARRPMAELAVATGAGVALTVSIGDTAVCLDYLEPRCAIPVSTSPGVRVRRGTAQARVHGMHTAECGVLPMTSLDSGAVVPNLICAAAALPLPHGGRAAVTSVIAGASPPQAVLVGTRVTATRIARLVRQHRIGTND